MAEGVREAAGKEVAALAVEGLAGVLLAVGLRVATWVEVEVGKVCPLAELAVPVGMVRKGEVLLAGVEVVGAEKVAAGMAAVGWEVAIVGASSVTVAGVMARELR